MDLWTDIQKTVDKAEEILSMAYRPKPASNTAPPPGAESADASRCQGSKWASRNKLLVLYESRIEFSPTRPKAFVCGQIGNQPIVRRGWRGAMGRLRNKTMLWAYAASKQLSRAGMAVVGMLRWALFAVTLAVVALGTSGIWVEPQWWYGPAGFVLGVMATVVACKLVMPKRFARYMNPQDWEDHELVKGNEKRYIIWDSLAYRGQF